MLKRIFIICCLYITGFNAMAQDYRNRNRDRAVNTYTDEEPFGKGFKIEHLFIGGNLALGFGSYNFSAGISPEIGYSFTNWLDGGLLVNLNYNSVRADPYYNNNIRQRSFNYGAGAFVRVYPVSFLFLHVGTEYNWIDYKLKDATSGQEFPTIKTNALSLLAGIGYGQRIVGRNNFHIALMIDLLNNPQSPYRDRNGVVLPIIKTGFDFYLHPRRQ